MKVRWLSVTSSFLAVLTLCLVGVFTTGCLLDGEEDTDEVTITVTAIGTVQAGNTKAVAGTIKSDPALTSVTYAVLDSATGTAVSASAITWTSESVAGETDVDLAQDAKLVLDVKAIACNKTHILRITAKAGSATETKDAYFTVSGGTCGTVTTLDTVIVTLGSWSNATYGSSLDADAMKVYKVAEAATVSAEIDIWYSNQAGGELWLMAPSVAAAQGHPPKNWTTKNATQMVSVSPTAAAAVTSQADIDALWTANVASAATHIAVQQGSVIVVNTNKGAKRLVAVLSVVAGDTGQVVVVGTIEI